jgi:hypothetical protein
MAGRKPLPDDTPVFPKCGHSRLDEENVYVHPRTGVKSCRTCAAARRTKQGKAEAATEQADCGGREARVVGLSSSAMEAFRAFDNELPPVFPPCGGDI